MGRPGAVLAPGYGGAPTQSIVRRLAERLARDDIEVTAVSLPTSGSLAGGYPKELAVLRRARDALLAAGGPRPVALAGRSYGGRMCVRLAAEEPPAALVVLGHPISPPGRPRPDDEAALLAVRCPTLIVQGEHDPLGPLTVLQRIAAENPHVELAIVAGAGHSFGKREADAVEIAGAWLARILLPNRPPPPR